MLIIAQPKSASTSLLLTLSQMMKVKPFRGTKRKDFNILEDEFEQLQLYHTLIFERSPLDIMRMVKDQKILYREHLLPNDRTFKILDKYDKFIVLLRNPEDSYDNYKRILDKKNEQNKKILEDLILFYSRYQIYLKNRPEILQIDYEDLVINYKDVLKDICKYWKIKNKIIPLKKENYTGIGEKRLNDICKK